MSALLSCQLISKSFFDKVLFEDLQFSILQNDRIGLIGANGSGKSTLLKILSGIEEADSGEVITQTGTTVAYVPQLENFDEDICVFEALLISAENANLADAEAAVNITLGKSGFKDKDARVLTLSGGWKKRLSLACGFVKQAELLLLDEPTNHLDLEGVVWLEKYLKNANFSWLVVSHDRIFLETSTNKIAEIDKVYPQGIYISEGTLGDFLKNKSAYLASEEQRKSSLQNKVKREKEWLSRNPKARSTKSKSREDRAYAMMDELKAVKEKLHKRESEIDFSGSNRKTKKLFAADKISKTLGSKNLFKNTSFVLSPKMKVGILGPNGSGKTTLLKIISGEIETDNGKVERAENLKTVYFDQHRASLDLDSTLKDTLAPTGDSVVYQGREIHLVSWAARFQFGFEQLNTRVSELSGGEQARLLIARLMLEEADLLLLDEPTNDLDIETLEVLEESLLEFPGAVVLISHDRYLMGRVCNSFLALDGKGKLFPCASLDQWLADYSEGKQTKSKQTKVKEQDESVQKISFEERKEYGRIERAIAKAESQVLELDAKVHSPEIASDPQKLEVAYKELTDATKKVETLYQRWEELEAKF
ncbi:MAG: ABC-F family ATP-binding cassette domain-containing protein [Bdellovibrionota bacterium]